MTTFEFVLRLLKALLPITIIIIVIVLTKRSIKKEVREISAAPFAGMRDPTDEEANIIKYQVIPREKKKATMLTLIFLPLAVIITGAFITNYQPGNLFATIAGSCLVFGIWSMFIGMVSSSLQTISDLKKKRYQITDCTITEINIRPTGKHRVDTYFATVKDCKDNVWETPLPKDLLSVSEGTRCLLLIYDSEEKINRNRKNGIPVFRREVIVPDIIE